MTPRQTFEKQGGFEVDLYAGGGASEDWAEATLALLKKRKPNFKGC